MITLHQILSYYGLNPTEVKLARHGNAELPILETYHNDIEKFEAYQGFQAPNRFDNATHIAVFAPAVGTTALFLGVWDIVGKKSNSDFTKEIHSIIDKYSFSEVWHTDLEWYSLKKNPVMDELSERLVVDLGKSMILL